MRPNLQYFFFKSPHPKTLKISIFRVPNEVRSSLFPWWKLCARSLLHCIFCWLYWTSLMVVILEVDAIEGVAFHYVDNFTMLMSSSPTAIEEIPISSIGAFTRFGGFPLMALRGAATGSLGWKSLFHASRAASALSSSPTVGGSSMKTLRAYA